MTNQMDHEDWAVSEYVRRRTVRILNFTDKAAGGTGVKVNAEGRFFIATCAHVMPDGHEIRLLVPNRSSAFIRSFRRRDDDARLDLGLLEISHADAQLLGGSFVDEIATNITFDDEWKTVVCGYPGQMIAISEKRSETTLVRTYDFRSMVFFSGMVPESEWPTHGFERPVVKDAELFVHFSASAELEQVNLLNRRQHWQRATWGSLIPPE
ncbi:MAG TPA: hypothetical protein VGM76_05265 [Lacipirellulaceae bacterium]|jgi:hypothetical protein